MAEREAVAVDITVDVPVATWAGSVLSRFRRVLRSSCSRLESPPTPSAPPIPVDGNVAKCMAYELLPTPNYTHPNGNDDTSDSYDLTDGVYVAASHASDLSVTWKYSAAVRVSIDLERPACAGDPLACHPIEEIFFQIRDQKGAAGVWCPQEVTFEVSDDGVSYYPVSRWALPAGYPESADCGAEGPDFNGRNYLISSGLLETRGAHVRVVIETQPWAGASCSSMSWRCEPGRTAQHLTNYLENPLVDYESGARRPGRRLEALRRRSPRPDSQPLAAGAGGH